MRRLSAFLVSLVLLLPLGAHAEESALFAWTLEVGSHGQTIPTAMIPASDGGVIIVGNTTSHNGGLGEYLGGQDGFVLRVDARGELRWWRRLGGAGDDLFTDVQETSDGGCVILGTTTSADGDASAARGGMDAWVVRLDAQGETLFTKCLGGSSDDELITLLITEEGQYFVCGRTQSRNGDLRSNHGGWDAWAALLGQEDGKPIWSYRFGEAGDDSFTQAVPLADGWFIIGEMGEELSVDLDGNPIYVSRPIAQVITSEGEAAWDPVVMLGDTSGHSRHLEILQAESGWVLAGETNARSPMMPTPSGGKDIWVLLMRQTGYVGWQRVFGGNSDESLHSLTALPGGGYIILASTESNDGNVVGAHGAKDVWVVRISSSGIKEWEQALGGSRDSTPAGLLLREDGGFLVLGTTTSQDGDIGRHTANIAGFISHLAPNGNLEKTQVVPQIGDCTLLSVVARDGIGYALGVTTSEYGTVESAWIARLAEENVAK